MCNFYRAEAMSGTDGLARRISEVVRWLKSPLIRKTNPAPVVLADDRVEVMRWGFSREFNPAINNARSDKLEGGMWREAFHERRCLIPMFLFYEWGPGTGGRKQAFEIQISGEGWLWAAGIWELHPDHGSCCSMITTAANQAMARVHDRMPALLRPDAVGAWLAGTEPWDFQPYPGELFLTPCESPLVAKQDKGGRQGELF